MSTNITFQKPVKNFPTIFLAMAATLLFFGCNPSSPTPPPVEEKISPEEAAMRRQANDLGTRLYAEAQKAEEQNLNEAAQEKALRPIYSDIEQFVFNRMSGYSNRISSITITYNRPSMQCIIYVKPGNEDELTRLKRAADTIVGRVVENLPVVRYLMIKSEQ